MKKYRITFDEAKEWKSDHSTITGSFQCICGQFIYFPLENKIDKIKCSCGQIYLIDWDHLDIPF